MHTEWGPWIRSMNLKGSKYEIQGGGLRQARPKSDTCENAIRVEPDSAEISNHATTILSRKNFPTPYSIAHHFSHLLRSLLTRPLSRPRGRSSILTATDGLSSVLTTGGRRQILNAAGPQSGRIEGSERP